MKETTWMKSMRMSITWMREMLRTDPKVVTKAVTRRECRGFGRGPRASGMYLLRGIPLRSSTLNR
jgi:hypothetical protein